MGPVTGLVLYSVIWAMVFMVAIPIRLQTQGESGHVVPGTHQGSPERHDLKKKAWITTAVSAAIWALLAWIILTGQITLRDVDLFERFGPGPVEERGLGG
jgi:predicted secreted protein